MKILVGYTRAPEAAAALERAAGEAQLHNAELFIVHAVRDGGTGQRTATYGQELEEVGEEYRKRGLEVQVQELVRPGSPASSILALAHEETIDLIVIGLRSRSPVGKLVLGSDAQEILLGAACPVLSVKADRERE